MTFVCTIVQDTRESWNQNIVFDAWMEYLISLQSFGHEQSAVVESIKSETKKLMKMTRI